MKFLIISDTHGRHTNLRNVFFKERPFDKVLHLGDVEGCEREICTLADCPVEFVMGNNDYFSHLPKDRIFNIGDYKIWMTHGHQYGVLNSSYDIRQAARKKGVDVVIFGHTHMPFQLEEEDLLTLNPGSISFPRQSDREATYMVGSLDEDGKLHVELKTV